MGAGARTLASGAYILHCSRYDSIGCAVSVWPVCIPSYASIGMRCASGELVSVDVLSMGARLSDARRATGADKVNNSDRCAVDIWTDKQRS